MNVPPNATVVGVPGHIVAVRDDSNSTIQRLPDPEWERIDLLDRKMEELHELVGHLEEHMDRVHEDNHVKEPTEGSH